MDLVVALAGDECDVVFPGVRLTRLGSGTPRTYCQRMASMLSAAWTAGPVSGAGVRPVGPDVGPERLDETVFVTVAVLGDESGDPFGVFEREALSDGAL
ncbi:hypothetical protein Shyhy02_63540 [Streptomyces hygroscopicus subsp. hygroscopicus]|nr:hypothetical protein Shyhy02_63540 [Streptomyces hygroscopicus subsp. hygroscopicus]